MFTAPEIVIRELDHRTTDGIDVALFWDSQTNRVFVAVEDQRQRESFEVEVDPAEALAAFRHPFAYAKCDHRDHALAAWAWPELNINSAIEGKPMISSYTTYRAGLTRIDDLQRQAAEWRRASALNAGMKVSLPQPPPRKSRLTLRLRRA